MASEQYKILRVLNNKGTVFLATDKDGNKFVLKTLLPDSVPIYEHISELSPHEKLQKIFSCIEQDGNTIAVCEYIEGNTLHELLESGRTFPIKDIRNLICDLCDAVEHLHKNSIIHRDINPNNILLDSELNLKLADYSIARLYNGTKDSDTTIYGTEGYSAPEQYGFKETRFTADVYSIGMVLKLLLNSCADGSVAEEVHLRKIAAKCTAFDPDSRFMNAAAVRSAIKRLNYILPTTIICATLAVIAAFISGMLVVTRDTENFSENSETSQSVLTSTTTTVSTATATTSNTAPVTTIVTATPSVTTSVATTITPVSTTNTSTPSQISETSPTATTNSTPVSTATSPVFVLPEYLELFTLKGSDMNNPNKITVTPVQNEKGYFNDSFEYEFYDDPAVHGEWEYCTIWSLNGAKIPATAEGIKNNEHWGELYIDSLTIHSNGKAEIYFSPYNGEPAISKWTNGYIITENGDGVFAERLFTVTIDDTEFLFMESKSGDYLFHGEIYCYYIFMRKE